MRNVDGLLDDPVAEVQIKPWHIIALLGAGGLAAYFLLRKKETQTTPPAPKNEAKPATSGLSGLASLGEQTEPLFEGHPMIETVRGYSQKGWTVFKVPTGEENVMNNRERHPVFKVFAAPPGRRVPARSIVVRV